MNVDLLKNLYHETGSPDQFIQAAFQCAITELTNELEIEKPESRARFVELIEKKSTEWENSVHQFNYYLMKLNKEFIFGTDLFKILLRRMDPITYAQYLAEGLIPLDDEIEFASRFRSFFQKGDVK